MLTVRFKRTADWLERELAIERVLGKVSSSGGSDGKTRTLVFRSKHKPEEQVQIAAELQRVCPGIEAVWGPPKP